MIRTIRKDKQYYIQRSKHSIVILPNKQGNDSCWYDKEIITLRKASKELECYECGEIIPKSKNYIRDKFIFSGEYHEKQFKVNFICLDCWKGEIPVFTSENRELEKEETEKEET
jgi:hypothetical protein